MINEIKEALEKSTPGPWRDEMVNVKNPVEIYRQVTSGTGYFRKDDGDRPGFCITGYIAPEDAHLIANTPTYIRYLLDELEKANTALYTHESYDRTVAELHEENEKLRADHAVMKKALMQERDDALTWDGITVVGRINSVLSTIKTTLECDTCCGEGDIGIDDFGHETGFECPTCKGTGKEKAHE